MRGLTVLLLGLLTALPPAAAMHRLRRAGFAAARVDYRER